MKKWSIMWSGMTNNPGISNLADNKKAQFDGNPIIKTYQSTIR